MSPSLHKQPRTIQHQYKWVPDTLTAKSKRIPTDDEPCSRGNNTDDTYIRMAKIKVMEKYRPMWMLDEIKDL